MRKGVKGIIMFRLKEITINCPDEAVKLMQCLGYKFNIEKEGDLFIYEEYKIGREIYGIYSLRSKKLIIYPMTYCHSQSQWEDIPGLYWERETIDNRVRKCLEKSKINNLLFRISNFLRKIFKGLTG